MQTKIALVTGGSRGLGRNMALSLAKKNIDVVITYNTNKEEAEKVCLEVVKLGQRAIAKQLDMGDLKSYDAFISGFTAALHASWGVHKFDYLINNAGFGATMPFAQMTEELFDNLLNVHYKGVYFFTQKLLPHLNDNGGIVNISSGSTRFCVFGYSAYASMKGAIEVFTKYLSKELGPRGICVNVVAPGATETDFNSAAIRNNPQVKANITAQTPLGRVGQADDIGGVVAFLCTSDAKWINGQRIEVSGGIN